MTTTRAPGAARTAEPSLEKRWLAGLTALGAGMRIGIPYFPWLGIFNVMVVAGLRSTLQARKQATRGTEL